MGPICGGGAPGKHTSFSATVPISAFSGLGGFALDLFYSFILLVSVIWWPQFSHHAIQPLYGTPTEFADVTCVHSIIVPQPRLNVSSLVAVVQLLETTTLHFGSLISHPNDARTSPFLRMFSSLRSSAAEIHISI